MFGEQLARRMLADAGFVDIEVHPAPGDPGDAVYVSRKATPMTTTTSRESALHGTQPSRSQPRRESDGRGPRRSPGFAFVVLNVVGTFLPGSPPASDASTAKIAAYFRDHSGAIKAQLLLGGLGIAALMWWFGALWRILSRAEGERPRLAVVAAVSLVTGLTLALLNGAINATAAIRAVNADTTHLFYSFSLVVIAAAGFGIGTLLIATSAVTYRARVTAPWISYLGWLAGHRVPREHPRHGHRLERRQPDRARRVPRLVRVDHRHERRDVAGGVEAAGSRLRVGLRHRSGGGAQALRRRSPHREVPGSGAGYSRMGDSAPDVFPSGGLGRLPKRGALVRRSSAEFGPPGGKMGRCNDGARRSGRMCTVRRDSRRSEG